MHDIAVHIITGFLGSGKTSLLQHVLQHGLQQRRVAVIVNDLGDFNTDGRVLAGFHVDRMVELSNGCICCSSGPQFSAALQEIISTVRPELVLVEATGAAVPAPLLADVRHVGLRLDGVITVVDGSTIRQVCAEALVTRQQIESADFLILNKCDLLDPAEQQSLAKFLRRYNPRALLLPSVFGQVSADLLFTPVTSPAPHGTTALPRHLHEDGIDVLTYTTSKPLHRQRFERVVQSLPRHLYRAKGILYFDQDTWSSLFSYTCGRYDMHWLQRKEAAAPLSYATFIGKHLARQQTHLLTALAECELSA